MLKDGKITRWLAGDFLKVWLSIFRNCDEIMQKRFNQDGIDVKACTSKMLIAYLKLHNINILGKLANKRDTVRSHKESASHEAKRSKKIILKLLRQSSFKLTTQAITSNKNNADDLKIHMNQCLNELNHADK